MRLNGKDVRVVSGALTIFLYVPFGRTSKTELPPEDIEQLEDLDSRVYTAREGAYSSLRPLSAGGSVDQHLAVEVDVAFERKELRLLALVLREVLAEDIPPNSNNVYFNGDQYGVRQEDFWDLLARIEAELEAEGCSEERE